MSADVEIIKFRISDVRALRAAAVPQKRLLGPARDLFWEFVRERGVRVVEYRWSGFYFMSIIGFLEDRLQVNLLEADHDELARHIAEIRGISAFVFTKEHRERWMALLGQAISERELEAYDREFSERQDPDAGRAMHEGIAALHGALSQIDDDSLVLVCIVT